MKVRRMVAAVALAAAAVVAPAAVSHAQYYNDGDSPNCHWWTYGTTKVLVCKPY